MLPVCTCLFVLIPSLDKRSLKAEVCLVSCDHGSEAYIGGFLHFLYQFYSPAVFAISKYLPLAMRLCLDKKDVCPCVWRFPSFFVVPTFKAFQAMMHSAPSRFFLCMLCGATASSNHAQDTYDQWLMQAPIHRLTLEIHKPRPLSRPDTMAHCLACACAHCMQRLFLALVHGNASQKIC